MDAHLDTLSTELYQVNIHVGRIAQWLVIMGGFTLKASPPPLLMASDSEAEDGDDDNASDDGDASSTNEMST